MKIETVIHQERSGVAKIGDLLLRYYPSGIRHRIQFECTIGYHSTVDVALSMQEIKRLGTELLDLAAQLENENVHS